MTTPNDQPTRTASTKPRVGPDGKLQTEDGAGWFLIGIGVLFVLVIVLGLLT